MRAKLVIEEGLRLGRRNQIDIIDEEIKSFLKKNKCKCLHIKDHVCLFFEGLSLYLTNLFFFLS